MATVFVHGNPETTFVWSDLVPELQRRGVDDIVLLSPPGFGVPIPTGFDCTMLGYHEWLVGELEKFDEPVDLVGHDWGAGHVYGVAAERPDLLRTWSADCCGIIDPDYVWHPAAQVWQTPEQGEALIREMMELDQDEFVASYGIPARLAPNMAEHFDEMMGQAILTVYRSAVQPVMRELGDRLAHAPRRPALIINATKDAYTNPEFTPRVAERVGARVLTLEGCGHWWMFEKPAEAAEGLIAMWASA